MTDPIIDYVTYQGITDHGESLGEALPKEMARVREVIVIYRGLPGGVGNLAAHFMEQTLRSADRACVSGDVVAMLRAHKALQEIAL